VRTQTELILLTRKITFSILGEHGRRTQYAPHTLERKSQSR
jgi:hypothetical protein